MANVQAQKPARGFKEVVKSYFYWTYSRGSFHYDVMVTLILVFIFVTPHLWNFGDKPFPVFGPAHPIVVSGSGGHDKILTVSASDVTVPDGASDAAVKKALRKAIEPVTGDAVYISHWETRTDTQGNLNWQVWAHW